MKFYRVLGLTLLSLALIRQVNAEENRWEAAVFGGGHFSGHVKLDSESGHDQLNVTDGSSFGLAVGRDLSEESAVEIMWTRQNARLQATGGATPPENLGALMIDQYRFNGLYFPPQPEGRARWFVLCGLGASVFSPEGNYGSSTQLNFALGGGSKIRLTDHLGLRLDAHWLATPFNSDGTIACSSTSAGGHCAVASSGQLLSQFELTGGVFVRI
jgi:hypothetical protein